MELFFHSLSRAGPSAGFEVGLFSSFSSGIGEKVDVSPDEQAFRQRFEREKLLTLPSPPNRLRRARLDHPGVPVANDLGEREQN